MVKKKGAKDQDQEDERQRQGERDERRSRGRGRGGRGGRGGRSGCRGRGRWRFLDHRPQRVADREIHREIEALKHQHQTSNSFEMVFETGFLLFLLCLLFSVFPTLILLLFDFLSIIRVYLLYPLAISICEMWNDLWRHQTENLEKNARNFVLHVWTSPAHRCQIYRL